MKKIFGFSKKKEPLHVLRGFMVSPLLAGHLTMSPVSRVAVFPP